jgi:hypothetical protein
VHHSTQDSESNNATTNLKISSPPEAKDHLDQGHTIYVPTRAGFCHCSCGLSFRVGVVVDYDSLEKEDPFDWKEGRMPK